MLSIATTIRSLILRGNRSHEPCRSCFKTACISLHATVRFSASQCTVGESGLMDKKDRNVLWRQQCVLIDIATLSRMRLLVDIAPWIGSRAVRVCSDSEASLSREICKKQVWNCSHENRRCAFGLGCAVVSGLARVKSVGVVRKTPCQKGNLFDPIAKCRCCAIGTDTNWSSTAETAISR